MSISLAEFVSMDSLQKPNPQNSQCGSGLKLLFSRLPITLSVIVAIAHLAISNIAYGSPREFKFGRMSDSLCNSKLEAPRRNLDSQFDRFGEFGWQAVNGPSLRGHIVNAHLQAYSLHSLGVPRYDIEIAAYRGIELAWVVEQIYKKLERSDADIESEISSPEARDNRLTSFGPNAYRQVLVKTLKFIDSKSLAVVDWPRVIASYPTAMEEPLDIEIDSRDVSFFAVLRSQNLR